jgi:hypothetical protein
MAQASEYPGDLCLISALDNISIESWTTQRKNVELSYFLLRSHVTQCYLVVPSGA